MSKPANAAERRRFQRFHFEGTVKLYSDKAMWESKLDDISLKGVLIEHPPGWNGKIGSSYRISRAALDAFLAK